MGDRVGRVVLLGATGYTGRIVFKELQKRRLPALLIGRDSRRLGGLASAADDVEIVEGDVASAQCFDGLLTEDDVVVSTVGPFSELGEGVVRAVVAAGASYLDSTGEPDFIHSVYSEYARRSNGAVVIPAFGYDYVPGAVAAASILDAADDSCAVRVGYFLTDESGRPLRFRDLPSATTPATRESLVRAIGRPSFVYRRSPEKFGLVTEPAGRRLMRFRGENGEVLQAVSVGGSEHFALPEAYPRLDAIDVGMGWLNGLTGPAHVGARLLASGRIDAGLSRAQVAGALSLVMRRRRSYPRPGVRSMIVAECYDPAGRRVGRTVWRGVEPYVFTGRLLAWGASELLTNRPAPGVHGGLRAFGTANLIRGVRAAGISPASV